MKCRKGWLFPSRYKWVLAFPNGRGIAFVKKPKRIASGYMDENGHRYIRDERRSFNSIELVRL